MPAEPGPWRRSVGGSALYAIAGARLWIDPARIGIATRTGKGYPFDLEGLLREAGVGHVAINRTANEHLIEWFFYEEDGSRRSLPRNKAARDVGAEGSPTMQPFYDVLLGISPTADDIPAAWLPAAAMHICPQVGTRHRDSLNALRGKVGWISVDPSPHYSRKLDAAGLAEFLSGATAFMPSIQEIRPLLETMTAPEAAVQSLRAAGFPEVVLKRGAEPSIVAFAGRCRVDPGDAGADRRSDRGGRQLLRRLCRQPAPRLRPDRIRPPRRDQRRPGGRLQRRRTSAAAHAAGLTKPEE